MAQNLDFEPLLTPKKIETWAGTKLNTCPIPTLNNKASDYMIASPVSPIFL